jgi:hypothetical protein
VLDNTHEINSTPGLGEGWGHGAAAFLAIIALIAPIILFSLMQLPTTPVTATTSPFSIDEPIVPTGTFKKPRSPRNTNHLDCLIETA